MNHDNNLEEDIISYKNQEHFYKYSIAMFNASILKVEKYNKIFNTESKERYKVLFEFRSEEKEYIEEIKNNILFINGISENEEECVDYRVVSETEIEVIDIYPSLSIYQHLERKLTGFTPPMLNEIDKTLYPERSLKDLSEKNKL